VGTGDGTGGGVRRDRAGTDEPLTAQKTRVALLVADGLTNKQVAAALFLSARTVEHHVGSILRKRGLRSRTQLAAVVAGGQRAGSPVAGGDSDLR
jgi:DNA-binding NarL/FixJ family response regulator